MNVDEVLTLLAYAEAGELDRLREEVEDIHGHIYRGHVLFDESQKFGSLYGLRTQVVVAGWYVLINARDDALRCHHGSANSAVSARLVDPTKAYSFRIDSGNQLNKPNQPLQQWYYNIDDFDGAPARRPTFRATVWQRAAPRAAAAPRAFIVQVKPKGGRSGLSPRKARNASAPAREGGGESLDELDDPESLESIALFGLPPGAAEAAPEARPSTRGSKRKAPP